MIGREARIKITTVFNEVIIKALLRVQHFKTKHWNQTTEIPLARLVNARINHVGRGRA